jgi:hypothetical protein
MVANRRRKNPDASLSFGRVPGNGLGGRHAGAGLGTSFGGSSRLRAGTSDERPRNKPSSSRRAPGRRRCRSRPASGIGDRRTTGNRRGWSAPRALDLESRKAERHTCGACGHRELRRGGSRALTMWGLRDAFLAGHVPTRSAPDCHDRLADVPWPSRAVAARRPRDPPRSPLRITAAPPPASHTGNDRYPSGITNSQYPQQTLPPPAPSRSSMARRQKPPTAHRH